VAVDAETLATIRLLIQAQAEQLRNSTPSILLRPGTVVTFATTPQTGTVLVDGDDTDAIPVVNITGVDLVEGRRVMVLFQQPHGAFVMGFAAP
jgi:hypothetical protein